MSTLDLDLLRTFVAIADHSSFAEAGRNLGRTQASVTQHMQRLEQQVGVPLLRKQGRHKSLTDAGRQLLRHARQMLALNDEALAGLRLDGPSGVLRIGSPHDIADTILPPLLSHIARSAPNLRLEIDVGRSPFLMEDLQRGKVDMVISTRTAPGLEGFALRTSPVWWICAAQYQHLPSEPLPLVLVDEPSLYRKLALEALERAGIAWRQAYLASNLIGVLPALPDVTYHLWVRANTVNPLVRQAYAMVRASAGL